MNDADFPKEGPTLQLLGKEFIIVVVIVFSAFSFTLGYFVGKRNADRKPDNLSHAAEMAPIHQKQDQETPPEPQVTPVAEKTSETEDIARDLGHFQQRETLAKQAAPVNSLQAVKEKTRGETELQQMPRENNQNTGSKDGSALGDSKKTVEPVYAVQIGAFKSSSEAEAFRKKQAAKGLKTYITAVTNTKKEKIYKVKTGEFSERKSAELLTVKLNNTWKLKTFVTLKNE
jgi:cell division protein FtsN